MRTIPEALMKHKKQASKTLCQLIKIKTEKGDVIGMTDIDRGITYDDGTGDGPVHYYARIGFEPESIETTSDGQVNNTEFQALFPSFDFPLSRFAINAGEFDYAKFVVYEVNYEDLTMGHWIVMSGALGEMTEKNGMVLWGELRSLTDQLKKPIVDLYSRTSRATFGSQKGDERQPSQFDTDPLWSAGTITSISQDEPARVFTADFVEAQNFYFPGILQFTSGKNKGAYIEIEQYDSDSSGSTFSLSFPVSYSIQVGDTIRARPDSTGIARDDQRGAKYWWGADWIHHFRGEPDIPIGQANTVSMSYKALVMQQKTKLKQQDNS